MDRLPLAALPLPLLLLLLLPLPFLKLLSRAQKLVLENALELLGRKKGRHLLLLLLLVLLL